jgi:hypothetical protein
MQNWKTIKGKECLETRFPGVWRLKEGGYWIRARAKNPRTEKLVEINRVVQAGSPADAAAILHEAKQVIRQGDSQQKAYPRFADYAVSLLEQKIVAKELNGKNSIGCWKQCLKILISAKLEDGTVLGQVFIDKIKRQDLEYLRDEMARWGKAPATTNRRLEILCVVVNSFVSKYDFPVNPALRFKLLEKSSWRTYTHEQPNSLEPSELQEFLDLCLERYPTYYAFFVLGFVLGQRSSSLTPLRKGGAHADILWEKETILFRRSHTRGDEILNQTKTKRDLPIECGPLLFQVLRWHVDAWCTPESDLLFPGENKKDPISQQTLSRVLADLNTAMVCKHLNAQQESEFRRRLGSKKNDLRPAVLRKAVMWAQKQGWTVRFCRVLTLRSMRRSYYVSCDRAKIEDATARLISGHASTSMADRYRSQQGPVQRETVAKVAKVIRLPGARQASPLLAAMRHLLELAHGLPEQEVAGKLILALPPLIHEAEAQAAEATSLPSVPTRHVLDGSG